MDRPKIFEPMDLSPARGEKESREDYKERRKNNNTIIKAYTKHGYLVWPGGMGTYIRSRDGDI